VTEQELREMERMWADGTSLKAMARRMGYTMEHLGFVMRRDRARFPKRHKSFTQGERDQWADRVLSGELTPRRAAELAGCGASAVRKWARARRADA